MPWTDIYIRSVKPLEKTVKLTDAGGLYLMVTRQGSKLWRLAYRFGGKQKTLAIGAYPTISLGKVREARAAARKLLAEGFDPSDVRRMEKRRQKLATENTFQAVAEEWVQKVRLEGRTPSTLTKIEWLLAFS